MDFATILRRGIPGYSVRRQGRVGDGIFRWIYATIHVGRHQGRAGLSRHDGHPLVSLFYTTLGATTLAARAVQMALRSARQTTYSAQQETTDYHGRVERCHWVRGAFSASEGAPPDAYAGTSTRTTGVVFTPRGLVLLELQNPRSRYFSFPIDGRRWPYRTTILASCHPGSTRAY